MFCRKYPLMILRRDRKHFNVFKNLLLFIDIYGTSLDHVKSFLRFFQTILMLLSLCGDDKHNYYIIAACILSGSRYCILSCTISIIEGTHPKPMHTHHIFHFSLCLHRHCIALESSLVKQCHPLISNQVDLTLSNKEMGGDIIDGSCFCFHSSTVFVLGNYCHIAWCFFPRWAIGYACKTLSN